MKGKDIITRARVYQEFEPSTEYVHEEDCDTLLLHLPDFSREQFRVQLGRSKNLIISGERNVQQNIWSRFRKEFPISTNCEVNKISAKFEGNILFIRQPKLITTALKEEEKPPVIEAMNPQNPIEEPKPQKPQEQVLEKPKEKSEERPQKIEDKTDEKRLDKDKEKNDRTSERQASTELVNGEKMDEEEDKGGKTALENYIQAFGGLVTKLNVPRKMMNMVLVVLMALVLGIYVSNLFKSWRKDEI